MSDEPAESNADDERIAAMRQYVQDNGTEHLVNHGKHFDCPGCIAKELEIIEVRPVSSNVITIEGK